MNILVTGGTGFIGSQLVEKLVERDKVDKIFILSRNKNKTQSKKIQSIKGDVSKKKTFKNFDSSIDIIYHLAAIIDESVPLETMRMINVKGTRNVLNFCREKDSKLIYTSTVGVYGEPKNPPADEKTPYNPRTNYEKTKCEAEKVVKKYMEKYGLKPVVLRPSLVYGTNSYWLQILKKANKGFPLIGKGNNHFHLLYIENLTQALLLSLEKGDGKIFNVADNKVYTYKESYEIICDELNVKSEGSIPVWLAKTYALLTEFKAKIKKQKPIIRREYIDRLIRERWYEIEKIKKELGYNPNWDFRSGIREVIKKFKEKDMF